MPSRHGVFSFSQTFHMSALLPFPPCFSHYIAILLIYQGKTANLFQNMSLGIKAKTLTPQSHTRGLRDTEMPREAR